MRNTIPKWEYLNGRRTIHSFGATVAAAAATRLSAVVMHCGASTTHTHTLSQSHDKIQ